MLLCVGEMLPYRSGSFNGQGLEPDVLANQTKQTKKLTQDSQYLAAASLLRGEQEADAPAQEAKK